MSERGARREPLPARHRPTHVSSLAVLLMLAAMVLAAHCEDLYKTLGVARSAGPREIKTAYKRLAKEWHPDKNRSPRAQEKITQLNRAYEILSDTEKRHHYDMTGEAEDSPNVHRGPTVFQRGNVFHFQFNRADVHRADSVTTQAFFNRILPESDHRLFLLFFYHDLCFQCAEVERAWAGLRSEMESYGVGMGSVHGMLHPRIASRCGVSRVPTVLAVVAGRPFHYRGTLQSAPLRDFLENLLPSGVVPTLTPDSLSSFISRSIERNRPQALLFSRRVRPSLLLKLVAFATRRQLDMAFVSMAASFSVEETAILMGLGVVVGERKMLVVREFEDAVSPIELRETNGLSLLAAVEGLALFLPRLSAPHMLDLACPVGGANRICAVLVVYDPVQYNDSISVALRGVARRGLPLSHTTMDFAYVDAGRQQLFLSAFNPLPPEQPPCGGGGSARPVLLLRRISNQHAQFAWLPSFCDSDDVQLLRQLVTSSTSWSRRLIPLKQLVDEEAPGFLGRQWQRLARALTDMSDFVSAIDSNIYTPLTTLALTGVLFCLVSLMAGRQAPPPHSLRRRLRKSVLVSNHGAKTSRNSSPPPVARVYKMAGESYHEAVLCAERGHLTLLLLLHAPSQGAARGTVVAAWDLLRTFAIPKFSLFFHHVAERRQWVEALLRCRFSSKGEEGEGEVEGEREREGEGEAWIAKVAALGENLAGVVALFGARKQFCIFPDLNVPPLDGAHLCSSLPCPCGHGTVSPPGLQCAPVGSVLGAVLGLGEGDSGSESSGSEPPSCESDEAADIMPSGGRGKGRGRSEQDWGSDQVGHRHNNTTDVDSLVLKPPRLIPVNFGMWMERLADGSLPRYSVREWPDW